MKARIAAEPGAIPPPLTQYEEYKRDIISVGTKRYKLRRSV
jgi:hypothetical protein